MTDGPIPPQRIEPLEPERRDARGCLALAVLCWIIIGGLIWWLR